ncbi:MAG: aldose 1-epimerase family protein [Planctomycetes bacterium]|nr:aldose 1-epimerase family protein [Planctomycetota bacterium]
MADLRIPVIDADRGLDGDGFSVGPAEIGLGGDLPWGIRCEILRGGPSDGVAVLVLDTGGMKLWILPTRGMGIWKGECDGIRLGWDSPVRGPVHPAFVDPGERGGLGWLRGFDEWIVRCGLAWNGAPGPDAVIDALGREVRMDLNLHGLIANTPAHRVDISLGGEPPHEIRVTGLVRESALFGPCLDLESTVRTWIGARTFEIEDRVRNALSVPQPMELLYHINFGGPVLEPGSRLCLPFRAMSARDPRALAGLSRFDRFGPPESGFAEQVYFFAPKPARRTRESIALLRNARGDRGVSVAFPVEGLPWFSLWKNTASRENGYVAGLEPATDLPNPRAFEREKGRLVVLRPRAEHVARLRISALAARRDVAAAEREIRTIQGRERPRIHPRIDPALSPAAG